MEPADLTLEILKSLREDIRSTREEFRSELRSTREELRTEIHLATDAVRTELRTELRATEMRLATEALAVASAVSLVTAELRGIRADRRNDMELFSSTTSGLRAQVDDHARRLDALEKKTG